MYIQYLRNVYSFSHPELFWTHDANRVSQDNRQLATYRGQKKDTLYCVVVCTNKTNKIFWQATGCRMALLVMASMSWVSCIWNCLLNNRQHNNIIRCGKHQTRPDPIRSGPVWGDTASTLTILALYTSAWQDVRVTDKVVQYLVLVIATRWYREEEVPPTYQCCQNICGYAAVYK